MLSARVMLPASSLGPRGIALRYLDGEARSSHPMKGIVFFFFFFFFFKKLSSIAHQNQAGAMSRLIAKASYSRV